MTSLDDPMTAENFIEKVGLVNKQHLILVNMIKDKSINPVFSNAKVEHLSDIYKQLAGYIRWQELNELEKKLKYHSIDFSMIDFLG